MRVVECTQPGAAGTIRLAERDAPSLAPGHVLVRTGATALNYVDVLLRRGRYAQSPEPPFVLGSELAGEVIEVGDGAGPWRPGDRVMAMTEGTGGLAEVVAVAADRCAPLPPRFSFEDGAAFLLTFLTAYIPMTRQVRIGPGSRVLVHAAAGGVGTAAVQVARHLGATTILATAGTTAKLEVARRLGATAGIDYRTEDVVARTRELTDGRGLDVVIDPVGGELTAQSLQLLSPLGTVVAIGYAGGAWPPVDPALLVGRNAALAGLFLGRLMKLAPDVVDRATAELLDLWTAGSLAPVIGHEADLGAAAEALDLLEGRATTGKVVLTV